MKKGSVLEIFFGLVIVGVVCTGCQSFKATAPQSRLSLEQLKTTATYDVIGDAKGTASGGSLFGFIPIGGDRKSGSIGSLRSGEEPLNGQKVIKMILFWPFYLCGGASSVGPVEQAALYNAIESVPSADLVIMPRYNIESSNYIVYSEKTVTVKGKAVRLNPSVK